jgi:hypothetical protein
MVLVCSMEVKVWCFLLVRTSKRPYNSIIVDNAYKGQLTKKTDHVAADAEPAGKLPDIEDILDSTVKVLIQQPMWDKLINAEIIL